MSPPLQGFCGGAYVAISPTFAADQQINLYCETRRTDGSAKVRALLGTPGLRHVVTSGGLSERGLFHEDGLALVVFGAVASTFDAALGTLTTVGTIADDGFPVSMASNGRGGDQVAIVGGGELKIYDTSTGTLSAAVVLPFTDPVMVAFMDGYFLINQRNSPVVWFSAIEDGTSWDAIDFFTRSGTSDNLIAIATDRSRVWCWGSKTTTLFYNSGDADTPFVPYPETATQIGIVSPWALTQRGDVFTWVAVDAHGAPRVVKSTADPAAQVVSTPPIDRWLSRCSTLETAECLTYAVDGHDFVAVTCPGSADTIQTYVWDDIERVWHARAGWNATLGQFTRWRARGCVCIGTSIYVGDYLDGRLYRLDDTLYADDGAMLVSERTLPYISESSQFVFVDRAQLVAEVGVGLSTGQGSDPRVDLWLSRDAAKTWVSAGSRSVGPIGGYDARTLWNNLGRSIANRLVFRLRQSDPVKRAWLGLDATFTPGTGQV